MARKRVLVLGGHCGRLTTALAVRHDLQVDVTVVSASDRFLFQPSPVWLPFGKRSAADITFPLGPTVDSHQVELVHSAATRLDLSAQEVDATAGRYPSDYLVLAPGTENISTSSLGSGRAATRYVRVRDTYRSELCDNVYAVGIAGAAEVPWQTATPAGIPKTGLPTKTMVRMTARYVAAQVRGDAPQAHEAFGDIPAVYVMDAQSPPGHQVGLALLREPRAAPLAGRCRRLVRMNEARPRAGRSSPESDRHTRRSDAERH